MGARNLLETRCTSPRCPNSPRKAAPRRYRDEEANLRSRTAVAEPPPASVQDNSREALPQALRLPGRRCAVCGRGHAGGRGWKAGAELVRERDGVRMLDGAEARGAEPS